MRNGSKFVTLMIGAFIVLLGLSIIFGIPIFKILLESFLYIWGLLSLQEENTAAEDTILQFLTTRTYNKQMKKLTRNTQLFSARQIMIFQISL